MKKIITYIYYILVQKTYYIEFYFYILYWILFLHLHYNNRYNIIVMGYTINNTLLQGG